jgi:hypothetical protein
MTITERKNGLGSDGWRCPTPVCCPDVVYGKVGFPLLGRYDCVVSPLNGNHRLVIHNMVYI